MDVNKQLDSPDVFTRPDGWVTVDNGWLKEMASWNMLVKLLHNGALHVCISDEPPLLNNVAVLNIDAIVVTFDTSHEPIF
jgi:hypothetical protein